MFCSANATPSVVCLADTHAADNLQFIDTTGGVGVARTLEQGRVASWLAWG